MPLDWDHVRERYKDGALLPPVAGTRKLTVARVDDEGVVVTSSIWTKGVARENLERAVDLMESGAMSRRWVDFVEQYGEKVTGERRSLTATILKDLGYLD